MKIHTLDFETFWNSKEYTLSKMGPIEYVRDPRFTVQLAGVSSHRDSVKMFSAPEDRIDECLDAVVDWGNDAVLGHNMSGFDALILSEYFGFKPKHIWDTIPMMRWTGLSSVCRERLATLVEKLGAGVKEAGTVVSDGKMWPNDFTDAERTFFKKYCADDVSQCRTAARMMMPYMTEDALKFISLTARMATEPVFALDEVMLEEYLKQLDAEADEARVKIMQLFRFESTADFLKALRSKATFADMLRKLGVEPPVKVSVKKTQTARAKDSNAPDVYDYAFAKTDVEFLALAEHDDPRVRMLVETRLEFNGSILRSRCETLLHFARQHKPLPVLLSAFRAHTSRYSAGANGEHSSDSVNFQNLSKRNPAHLVLRKAIKVPAGYKVVACDSSQIEARVNAWFCGQDDLVEHFRSGGDPYSELAAKFGYGPTVKEIHDGAKAGDKWLKSLRNAGKVGILSAQYGVGAVKYCKTLWRSGIKLDDNYNKHCEMGTSAHAVYRASNPFIVGMWKKLGKILEAMVAGYSGRFGGPNGSLMSYGNMSILGKPEWAVPTIGSPSGYHLRYPNLHYELTDNGMELVYDRFLGRNTVSKRIYSGMLLENIIQHLAFQILVWQACRMADDGLELKCNVHDSWACVVPDKDVDRAREKMEYWMRQAPAWADGCPIDCESEVGIDFTVV